MEILKTESINSDKKYGIRQSDIYQLFTYGHKYLDGKGHMMLIYPKNINFTAPLPVFAFNLQLFLWCVPFDLEAGKLVSGEWTQFINCFETVLEKEDSK